MCILAFGYKNLQDNLLFMDPYKRQMVLLVGFMSLLIVVVLFLFVYAPDPVGTPSGPEISMPGPVQSGIDASVEGWEALIEDFKIGLSLMGIETNQTNVTNSS